MDQFHPGGGGGSGGGTAGDGGTRGEQGREGPRLRPSPAQKLVSSAYNDTSAPLELANGAEETIRGSFGVQSGYKCDRPVFFFEVGPMLYAYRTPGHFFRKGAATTVHFGRVDQIYPHANRMP